MNLPAKAASTLAGKVVLITGASSGIGLGVARAFATAGARLILAARDPVRLQQAAESISQSGGSVVAIPTDITDRKQVDHLVAETIRRHGQIDILINNAGTGLIAAFEAIDVEDAKALMNTNLFGPMNCLQAVIPHMRAKQAGHIINIASVAGLRAIPNSSIYSASKAAVIALADAVRVEVRDAGICVTTICPGRVKLSDTRFFETAKKYGSIELLQSPETLTVDDVVSAIVQATISRPRLVVLPGHARLLHFLNRFAPRFVDNLLFKRMPRLNRTAPPCASP